MTYYYLKKFASTYDNNIEDAFYNTPIADSMWSGAKAGFGIGGAVGTGTALNRAFKTIYNSSALKASNPNILKLEGPISKMPNFSNRARFSTKAIKSLSHLPTKARVLGSLIGIGLGNGIAGSIKGSLLGTGLGLINNLRNKAMNPIDDSSKKIDYEALREFLS